MSEISIQVRRVTERVKQYYKLFGFRSNAIMRPSKSIIRASRRLGFDEIECVVAETARGTSVGFYSINNLQGLLYTIPYIFLLLIHIISSFDAGAKYLEGENALLGINWTILLSGRDDAGLDFRFIFTILIIGLLPLFIELLHQRIRLSNLKARFAFYTRDAIWETRETPASLLAMKATRSIVNHIWLLAILFFGFFALPIDNQAELFKLYQTNYDSTYNATSNAFSITAGMVIGLLSADKAIKMRKENSKVDNRSRITGGSLERRIDPILYGIQAATYSALISGLFLSVTFLKGSSFDYAFQLLLFAILGSIISSILHSESSIWISTSYALLLFFSSLFFIFKTGTESAYGYIVILQLFFLPIPFFLYFARSFEKFMIKEGINSSDWLYDLLPIFPLISIFTNNKYKQKAKQRYLDDLDRTIDIDELDNKIRIRKELLTDKNSPAHKLAMHYYELLLSYTASFEDDKFIYFPSTTQLTTWWLERSDKSEINKEGDFVDFVDKILWDPNYFPVNASILSFEKIGREMVLAIQ